MLWKLEIYLKIFNCTTISLNKSHVWFAGLSLLAYVRARYPSVNPYEVMDSDLNSDEELIYVICMENNANKIFHSSFEQI